MAIRDHVRNIEKERDAYHKKASTLTAKELAAETEKFKKLRAALTAELTKGAKKCPDCGNPPHGMFHDGTPNPFEIGCLHCANHRVRGALPEDAVADWNAGKYLPPREPGTAVATHADATGKVISQRTVKIQKPK